MELHRVFKSGTLAHSGCLLIYFFVIKPRSPSQSVSQRKWPKVCENSLIQQAVTVCVTKKLDYLENFCHAYNYVYYNLLPAKTFLLSPE